MPAAPGRAVLTIDLGALTENWRRLRALAGPAECAAAVKADAYGLGLERVAPALSGAGCRSFFVAYPAEGLALRGILPAATVFVLHGPGSEPEALAEAGIVPVLNRFEEAAGWAALAGRLGRSLPAALQLDTGMTRLGLGRAEVERLAGRPDLLGRLDLKLVMSHLACADQPEHPLNRQQLDAFRGLRALLPAAPASLANSAGIFLGPEYRFDMVRPGIALYGGSPFVHGANPMAEVVNLAGKILQVHEIDTPRSVGYGASHQVSGPGRIATVGVGYADGYPRALGNRGFGYIGGVRVPVVGRVSMDLITLDVSAVAADKAVPGAAVDLLGRGAALDEVAAAAGTISYEILTRLGSRYERRYLEGPAA